MDIHRSRFVAHPIFPVTAVAFSRSSDEHPLPVGLPQPALKLAIGRQNGDIEIWDPSRGQWVQEVVFPGDNKSIDGLAWTREPDETTAEGQAMLGQYRLFSIASSPAVMEWDMERGCLKKTSTGNFSEVWCFAAQPREQPGSNGDDQDAAPSQELVAGCGDGTIVVLSTKGNDLQFKRFLARVSGKRPKCVSITYQSRDRVLAGFMDSTIRVLDTRNGSTVRTMSLGAGIPQAPKNVIVWQLKCLPSGDIVSGDSNGEIVFWDNRSYSVTQRVRGHDSECLDIATSADGKTVVSSSNNGRLAVYQKTTSSTGRATWARTHHRRTHDGQVKSISAFDSKGLSVIVSGGNDLTPIATPLREYGKEHNRPLSFLPQQSPITSARSARLLVSWWDKNVHIWRIARKPALDPSPKAQPPRKLVAKLVLDTKDNIRSVSISDDGRVLAISTNTELKVFQLRRRPDVEALGIRKVECPKSVGSSGARLLRFSPNGKWLVMVKLDNEVHVVRLTPVPDRPKHVYIINKVVELERQDRLESAQTGFKSYERTISSLAFASDGSVLVTGDLSGYLDSWILEGHEDPTAPAVDVAKDNGKNGGSDNSSDSSDDDEVFVFYGQHWADNPTGHLLPKLGSAPLVLSFRPSVEANQTNALVTGNPGVHATRHNPHAHSHELPAGQHRLWVMTAQHQMHEFDVLAGRLSDWSRRNPTSALPEDFTKLKDCVKGAVWDMTASRARLWLYGNTWMFMLNVGSDLMPTSAAAAAAPPPSRKRRKSGAGSGELTAALQEIKRRKTNSGAGSRLKASHRNGLPSAIKRSEAGESTTLDLDDDDDDDDASGRDDEAEAEAEARLLQLTRLRAEDDDDQQQQQQQQEEVTNAVESQRDRKWWCTFKYRSILGIVPLDDVDGGDDKGGAEGGEASADVIDDGAAATAADGWPRPLEVVIVERPLWDARAESHQ